MFKGPKEYLNEAAENLHDPNLTLLCKFVLNDPQFIIAPGGSTHHHAYKGGLVQHTAEVAYFARRMALGLGLNQILTVAAIWHDYHKIYEYEFTEDKIVSTPYRKTVGHIVGSWDEFRRVACRVEYVVDDIERISHCLLSHHGRREFGSPVEPASLEAHILHAADMASMQGLGSDRYSTVWKSDHINTMPVKP